MSPSSTNAQTQQVPGGGFVCILSVFEAALELNDKSPAPWESVDLDVDQFTALYCCLVFLFSQYPLTFVLHRPFSYHLHQLFIVSSHVLSYIHSTSRRMTTRPTMMSTAMKAMIRATLQICNGCATVFPFGLNTSFDIGGAEFCFTYSKNTMDASIAFPAAVPSLLAFWRSSTSTRLDLKCRYS
jgi:hypothetical protein